MDDSILYSSLFVSLSISLSIDNGAPKPESRNGSETLVVQGRAAIDLQRHGLGNTLMEPQCELWVNA
jgi:hypothetical protein